MAACLLKHLRLRSTSLRRGCAPARALCSSAITTALDAQIFLQKNQVSRHDHYVVRMHDKVTQTLLFLVGTWHRNTESIATVEKVLEMVKPHRTLLELDPGNARHSSRLRRHIREEHGADEFLTALDHEHVGKADAIDIPTDVGRIQLERGGTITDLISCLWTFPLFLAFDRIYGIRHPAMSLTAYSDIIIAKRDAYMAHKLKLAMKQKQGKVVAIVGRAHVAGIVWRMLSGSDSKNEKAFLTAPHVRCHNDFVTERLAIVSVMHTKIPFAFDAASGFLQPCPATLLHFEQVHDELSSLIAAGGGKFIGALLDNLQDPAFAHSVSNQLWNSARCDEWERLDGATALREALAVAFRDKGLNVSNAVRSPSFVGSLLGAQGVPFLELATDKKKFDIISLAETERKRRQQRLDELLNSARSKRIDLAHHPVVFKGALPEIGQAQPLWPSADPDILAASPFVDRF